MTASLLTVHKFYSDFYYTNGTYSEFLGEDVQILNRWERHLLEVLDFKITLKATDIQTSICILAAEALGEDTTNHTLEVGAIIDQLVGLLTLSMIQRQLNGLPATVTD